MGSYTNWLLVFIALSCIMGIIVSMILHFSHQGSRFLSRLLAANLFCLSYALFGYLLYVSGEFLRVPHFYRTPAFFSLCVAPLTFLYIRSSRNQSFWFKRTDFLLFLPALFYTLQFIPFYLLPAEEKLPFIKAAIQDKSIGAREPEGLLPQGVGFLFRMTYSLILLVLSSILLYKWKKSDQKVLLQIKANVQIFRWLIYFNLVLASTFLVLIFGFIFHISHIFEQYRISALTLSFSVLFISFYLLFNPVILYGLQGWVKPEKPAILPDIEVNPAESESRRTSLSAEQMALFEENLKTFFADNQPFLKQRYAIKDLAREVGIPSYLLSAFINQCYGKNFSEYINDLRVDYIMNWVQNEPLMLSKYTLEVLGQMGGFASRASFISAVKRKTGKTPSEIFAGKSE